MTTLTFESRSLEETSQFGQQLASVLTSGTVVALLGELGAGKTTLVQSITAGLGVTRDLVHSPTFVLIQEYDGRLPVCHIDAYRLRDSDEFLELGADELLGAENVCLIEWANRVADVLPLDLLTVRLSASSPTSRRIELSSSGPRSAAILEKFPQG